MFATLVAVVQGTAVLAECLHFEPVEVELSGTLAAREFPGPPNYESVAAGDRAERAFILVLTKPICVEADPKSEINSEGQRGVRELHVWWPDGDLAPFVGKAIAVRGRLSTAVTGHHRTPVILEVTRARAG
jgi:hypothetical protein